LEGHPGFSGAEILPMLTDDEIVLGGYRFEDLQALRIIENRTDLNRKQKELGFPKPIKTGKSQAWFPKSEVHAWLRKRAALRDAPTQGDVTVHREKCGATLPNKARTRKAGGMRVRAA
jgi:hypothetical protein